MASGQSAGHACRLRHGAGAGGHRFGAAHLHHAHLFANRRATRVKVLVHDGIGIWLAARRLNQGQFVWPRPGDQLPAHTHWRRRQRETRLHTRHVHR
ncbi:IS66 family insertion sequence element accessory protein TnpB [Paraburkholderia steynii]|uniref:IS66 family insertion sequence element accessory protein TnpB n=1 Tax=Paraburkholderia steynii TaxID=1245441 RepID=UPI000B807EE3